MTKFRASSALFAAAIAAAFSSAATPAAAEYFQYKLDRAFVKSWSTSADADLPLPPKLAATPKVASPQAQPGPPEANPGPPDRARAPGKPQAAPFRTQALWGVRANRRY